jgi:hypothetical protein
VSAASKLDETMSFVVGYENVLSALEAEERSSHAGNCSRQIQLLKEIKCVRVSDGVTKHAREALQHARVLNQTILELMGAAVATTGLNAIICPSGRQC